ncbi:aminodeoxychorismate lyase [Prochlorothrix hollandica PCC 9006 = CALU 1027]|uniref:Endolytic murein transglycosylase n=1 Tax=Prochlorothrix hollandica PCC 9006 = CALU 1027 TaxID=317619 RepID=A0A0M2PWP9_PROHO|nr:aminodeoxychorismate lyase [Prochlorothrix hollandica PCC 9006 = CALU 1027]
MALVGFGTWQSWRWWSWAKAPMVVTDTAPLVQLAIEPGTSVDRIGQDLAAAGLIRSTTAWDVWSRAWSLRRDLAGDPGFYQAGTYALSPNQSLPDIARVLWDGEVEEIGFTIPEGWSIRQMADYFAAQGFFESEQFLAAAAQIPRDRFPWLPDNMPHLEGFLFPETYALGSGQITPALVIEMMLTQFETVALPLYQSQSSTLALTLKDWVTLASIVEKEAVLPEERARIAGVLDNRLRIGMNLQVDPTVEYGLGIQQTPDRPLTLTEVQTPSPYNTYVNPGLPPTPIASPSRASLEAVLNPEVNDYLYFVARYDGTHVFSQTLADHEAAQEAIHDARSSPPSSPIIP